MSAMFITPQGATLLDGIGFVERPREMEARYFTGVPRAWFIRGRLVR